MQLNSVEYSWLGFESCCRPRILFILVVSLAGYIVKTNQILHFYRRSDEVSRQINENFSTLLKLQRSLSAPVDMSNLSLLVNASALNSGPQQSQDDIR